MVEYGNITPSEVKLSKIIYKYRGIAAIQLAFKWPS
jgi:hypothetical protein